MRSWVVLIALALLIPAGADRQGRSPGLEKMAVPLTWLSQLETEGLPDYGPGDYGRRLRHDRRKRYYEIHIPPDYSSDQPHPVVLVLHGGAGFPSGARFQSNIEPIADELGFIVVYPAGSHRLYRSKQLYWNVGPKPKKDQRAVDDVEFIATVLDDLARFFNVDAQKVYATGISNGGQMTYRLACELPTRIAAIAPVAGPEQIGTYFRHPERPIPTIAFHGRRDTWFPWDGGYTQANELYNSRYLPPVEQQIAQWARLNRCELRPQRSEQAGQAISQVYDDGGEAGCEVVLWELRDGGHTWPNGRVVPLDVEMGPTELGPGGVGRVNRDIPANKIMLEFFLRHPLPAIQ